MEPTVAYPVGGGIAVAIILIALMVYYIRRGKSHRMTKPGLVEHAEYISHALSNFVVEYEAGRRTGEAVLAGDGERPRERPDLYAVPYNEGALVIYRKDYLPEIKILREEFAGRRVHEKTLDRVYGDPDSVEDVRTVSTALLVMAQKLR